MLPNFQDIPVSATPVVDPCQLDDPLTNPLEGIAHGEMNAAQARIGIEFHIKATGDFTKPYSVLMLWTWQALSERRTGNDLRHWHRLIFDIASRAEQMSDSGASISGNALAERFRALSDILRVSINMQSRQDRTYLTTRTNVLAVLQALKDRKHEWMIRADLLKAVELKPGIFSQTLTLMVLESLVEVKHQDDSDAMHYRITGEGIRRLATC